MSFKSATLPAVIPTPRAETTCPAWCTQPRGVAGHAHETEGVSWFGLRGRAAVEQKQTAARLALTPASIGPASAQGHEGVERIDVYLEQPDGDTAPTICVDVFDMPALRLDLQAANELSRALFQVGLYFHRERTAHQVNEPFNRFVERTLPRVH